MGRFNLRSALRSFDRNVRKAGRTLDRNAHNIVRGAADIAEAFVTVPFKATRDITADLFGFDYKPPEFPNPLLERLGSNNKLPVVYGQQRIAGILIYMASTGDDNKYLHLVYALCEGEIESIDEVYLDDIKSTDSRFNGKVYIPSDPDTSRTAYGWVGTDTQAAPADLISALPSDWGYSNQGRGVAYLYIRLEYDDKVFQGRPKVLADVRGKRIYDTRTSTTGYSANNALVLFDYLTNVKYGRGLNSSYINTTAVNTAANNCDTRMDARTTAPSGFLVNQTNHAAGDYLVIVDTGSNDIKAGDTFTRSGDTTQYLVTDVSGTAPDFTLSYLPAARTTFADNDTLDFQINYFEVGGLLPTDRQVFSNVKTLLESFRAMLPYYNGQYNIQMRGFSESSALTIDDSMMSGGVSFERGGKEYRHNKLTGKFGNPYKRWNTDIVIVEDSTYLTEDGGLILEAEVKMPLENNPYRARFRLETSMKESRQDISFSIVGGPELLQLVPGDIVSITYTSAGWVSKTFRIITMGLSITLVSCQLQEYESTDYNRTVPTGYPTTPDTNLPNPFQTLIRNSDVELRVSNWTHRSNPGTAQSLIGIAYGNNTFVVVGQHDGTDAYICYSVDGQNWFESTNPKPHGLNSVAYGNGLFVAVGFADGTDAYLVTSSDGVTWTEQTNAQNLTLSDICYSDDLGLFVTVGYQDGTDGYILTSSDGVTWTERSNPKSYNLYGVTYSSDLGIFIAVGANDGTDAYMVTSTDGTTWTEQANPVTSLLSVAAGNGVIAAVGARDGTDADLVISSDGVTWTEVSNPWDTQLNYITFGDGVFVAVGNRLFGNKSGAYILTSIDGATWTRRMNPHSVVLYGVGHSDDYGVFVAVGQATTATNNEAYLLTSLYGK